MSNGVILAPRTIKRYDLVMGGSIILRVGGEVQRPLELTFEDLAAIPEQMLDVGHIIPDQSGDAVLLEGIFILAGLKPSAGFLTLHSSRGDFRASVPLLAVRDKGMLLYRVDGRPLPDAAGGPVRFLIPHPEESPSDELDGCANVKCVERIELSVLRS